MSQPTPLWKRSMADIALEASEKAYPESRRKQDEEATEIAHNVANYLEAKNRTRAEQDLRLKRAIGALYIMRLLGL